MRLASFSIITALALLYAGLTVAETAVYQKWDQGIFAQRDIQAKLTYFQHRNAFIEQLLRRMAVDSQRDPGVAELLKEHRIKVVVASPEPMKDPLGSEGAPAAAPDKPASVPTPTPATSTPPHP